MTAPGLIADCVARLLPLMNEFGTQAVQKAAQQFVDNDPIEQARVKADVRRALGVDTCRSVLSAELFAELFREDPDQPERLAHVIPFRRPATGDAA